MTPATSSQQIADEADQTRAQLSSTLEDLKERLTPGQIFDEVFQGSSANATRFLRNLGTTVRDNPVPAVLVGAGLAMMMTGSTGLSLFTRASPGQTGHRRNLGERHENDARRYQSGQASEATMSGVAASVGESLRTTAGAMSEGLSEAGEALGRAAHDARDALYETGNRAADLGRDTVKRSSELSSMVIEQPLVAAALGVAMGAVLGAMLPMSEAENTVMGEASEAVKDSAADLASEQLSAAKNAAQQIVRNVEEEASNQGLDLSSAEAAVKDVASRLGAVADKATQSIKETAKAASERTTKASRNL